MSKIADFIKSLFSPTVVIHKESFTSADFPKEELDELWKQQEILFDQQSKLFDKLMKLKPRQPDHE